MSRRPDISGICGEIEHFHALQTKKNTEETVQCLRRICELRGFIIDRSKYCDLYGKVATKPAEIDESAKKEILLRVDLQDRTAEVRTFMTIPLDINVNSFKEIIHKYYGFPPSEQIFLLKRQKRQDDFGLNHDTLKDVKMKEGFYSVQVYLKDALLRKRKIEGQQFDTEKVVRGMLPRDHRRRNRRSEVNPNSPQVKSKDHGDYDVRGRSSNPSASDDYRSSSRETSFNTSRESSLNSTKERRHSPVVRERSMGSDRVSPRGQFSASQQRATQAQRQRTMQERQHRAQPAANRDSMLAQQMQYHEFEANDQPEIVPLNDDVKPVEGLGTWTCPICTFVNQAWRPGCEQCSTDKPN